MFQHMSLYGWRQFRHVDIEFHPRLTVLTGANGAGKTTLLNLVSRHFGWQNQFISTPNRRDKSAQLSYSTDYWDIDEEIHKLLTERELQLNRHYPTHEQRIIGEIAYEDGATTPLLVPTGNTASSYDVHLPRQAGVEGLHVSSHRATYNYQQVQSIPTVPRRRNEAFLQYIDLVRTRLLGGHVPKSPQHYMKETLIALATFGYGNAAVDADAESAQIFEEFQDVLRRMLPPKLGFQRLVIRVPEVVLETSTGSFSFDALSGGASAVVELAWQVFMYQPSGKRFVVTLDEPENHLHPELQKRVLSNLIAAFPSVQFIVATHSPFIVGSVPDSNVYVLDYDDTRKVTSTLLDTVNRAGSANEILRDVLGLDYTIPVWVEEEIDNLVERYANDAFTAETVSSLRREMIDLGLGSHASKTIARLAELKDSR